MLYIELESSVCTYWSFFRLLGCVMYIYFAACIRCIRYLVMMRRGCVCVHLCVYCRISSLLHISTFIYFSGVHISPKITTPKMYSTVWIFMSCSEWMRYEIWKWMDDDNVHVPMNFDGKVQFYTAICAKHKFLSPCLQRDEHPSLFTRTTHRNRWFGVF